ncbi:hypothetical protein VF14_13620 [Nostoc linckia z18]|uniref:Uncharacterized protein n=3 Tax=Nostoc linckia TaxID=92942 RepID=A0A9Q5ZC40_NOSLI|nr:hypothetical protein VF02_25975 [Nostoc linckia z1]PHJ61886.1 hypothetical protein VF05_27675 [Nostoc linckia z3]PHJ67803.1 hypothetical protein VF03_25425 [Nostoc linckia z2]PHJ78984.1 hypothetical protein VF06_27350 [Nostoc linckia z4]PHJ83311.1 hypothetical protein VF07_26920 [Nostoc linckia z6]PHJ95612.1 hypothetical protein VF04_18410 [Nostoc linckia z7]PHK03571.1 hypothetical protein VF08_14720 [Nostoc linckia z8]PHK09781.1 hypothetical protein VF09_14110 [Nostoc linckia z9]PHK1991
MLKFKSKMNFRQVIAITTSLVLSGSALYTRPVNANPAVLAPAAFCAGTAGVGCVLVGVAIIGGTIYYVWQSGDGKHYAADANGQINNSEILVGTAKPLQSRAISGIEAAKLGDAHWANSVADCYKIAKRIGKTLKRSHLAVGGGYWCIFPGEQTSFGDNR